MVQLIVLKNVVQKGKECDEKKKKKARDLWSGRNIPVTSNPSEFWKSMHFTPYKNKLAKTSRKGRILSEGAANLLMRAQHAFVSRFQIKTNKIMSKIINTGGMNLCTSECYRQFQMKKFEAQLRSSNREQQLYLNTFLSQYLIQHHTCAEIRPMMPPAADCWRWDRIEPHWCHLMEDLQVQHHEWSLLQCWWDVRKNKTISQQSISWCPVGIFSIVRLPINSSLY